MNLAVIASFPPTFDASETCVEVSASKGHLTCWVWSRTEDEVAEAGLGFVTLNAEGTADEPLAYSPKGIVVEGVHRVVAAETTGVGIGVEAFPNGGRSLRDRVKPRGVGFLLKEAIGNVAPSVVAEGEVYPRGCNETCHK